MIAGTSSGNPVNPLIFGQTSPCAHMRTRTRRRAHAHTHMRIESCDIILDLVDVVDDVIEIIGK